MTNPLLLSIRAVLFFLFLSTIASRAFSQSMLDFTFGNRGKVVTQINDTSVANNIAIQPDGKIVIAGNTTLAGRVYATLVRYNVDGSLDNSFGNGGKVVSLISEDFSEMPSSIAIQNDGKILMGGTYRISPPNNYDSSGFAVKRYNVNGTIDNTFGHNGTAKAFMASGWSVITKLLVKPDGKILAGGFVLQGTFEIDPVFARFKTNGSLDSTFGVNGKVEFNAGIYELDRITDMAQGNDGKIYAAAETRNSFYVGDFAALRLLSDGRLDSSYGNNGVVKTDFNNYYSTEVATGLVVLSDGSMILSGYTGRGSSPSFFALAKYKVDGSLDSTFGTNGKVPMAIDTVFGFANDILADQSGNLFVTGASKQNFAIVKYFSNGKIDSSFGRYGIDTTDFFGFADEAKASALQADGKIVLAGYAGTTASNSHIALARYSYSVLPLKLLTLTATKEGKTNVLQWTTLNEINTERFEIERSFNGSVYTRIGKTNAGLNRYSFIDNKPLAGSNYYRLKMINKGGSFEYSVVRLINNISSFSVNAYPLPAKGTLNIQIQGSKTEKADVIITDMSGKTIIKTSIQLSAGLNNTSIDIQSLIKGSYFLKVVTTETTESKKIVVL